MLRCRIRPLILRPTGKNVFILFFPPSNILRRIDPSFAFQTDGQTYRRTDGRTGGRIDGWTDRLIEM